MKKYVQTDEWLLIENKFNPTDNEVTESLCSIGNGHMGQRANFEEDFTGHTLQGSYVGGVYYPDKTRVGWWKNGYPEYFAKVLNSVNWIGLRITVDGINVDLAACEILNFERILDMKRGILSRNVLLKLSNGKKIALSSTRFVSMDDEEIGAINYTIKAVDDDIDLQIESYLDNDIKNKDANYDEKFWDSKASNFENDIKYISASTKKTFFEVGVSAITNVLMDTLEVISDTFVTESMYVSQLFHVNLDAGKTCKIKKFIALASSRNHDPQSLKDHTSNKVITAKTQGFDHLLNSHEQKWAEIWKWCDIKIEGDVEAQQGIRFNIFHLLQTYTGKDSRLNIGPKGFTGEKYGGSTYWDTEAYCIPFYMSTAGQEVARNLLVYRHNHLQKAIENASKLGFSGGAALYPMVTMNGEECHNEWEITFEEIHRNGAIAYAIYDYTRYTGDKSYIPEFGLEILIGIARFWAQRVNWSEVKKAFVMLGVTGPNEYENNVNNNWYTNYIAKWCLEYTLSCLENTKLQFAHEYNDIIKNTNLIHQEEVKWTHIIENMYLPEDKTLGVILQQEGFLDKELMKVDQLDLANRPINQKWSWDRILRSCFIKQADVLQGLYFFEDHFDKATIKRNFDFYEPMTVHESSLSPCVHAILASSLGRTEKAHELYLRTARLDLDNYNNDTEDGLHITSMAGTWLSVIKGFGGMRVKDDCLYFSPVIPDKWQSLSFNLRYRANNIHISFNNENLQIKNVSGPSIDIFVNNTKFTTSENSSTLINLDKAVLH